MNCVFVIASAGTLGIMIPPSVVLVLYGMIAVAGWLVWRRVGADRVLVPYAVQLVLNIVDQQQPATGTAPQQQAQP